mgnify:CR=1 FL=1
MAAALGLEQLRRAEVLRAERETIARFYLEALADVEELELPPDGSDRVHAWHLFVIRLRLDRLLLDRNQVLDELRQQGVNSARSTGVRSISIPTTRSNLGWRPEHLPAATALWERIVSLPIFPGMRDDEREHVVRTVKAGVRASCSLSRRARRLIHCRSAPDCRAPSSFRSPPSG